MSFEATVGRAKWGMGTDQELPPPGMPPEVMQACPAGTFGTPPSCYSSYYVLVGALVVAGAWVAWHTRGKTR